MNDIAELEQYLIEMRELIERMPKYTPKWISVKEREPVFEERYLVAMKDGDRYHISIRKWKDAGWHRGGAWERNTAGVRFWSFLPEPPEMEEMS